MYCATLTSCVSFVVKTLKCYCRQLILSRVKIGIWDEFDVAIAVKLVSTCHGKLLLSPTSNPIGVSFGHKL